MMGDQLPDIPGYDVEAELGRGGMGVVYRARRHRDGTVLALKMILRGRGASFAELARFRIEAEALTCLDHPNIVTIRGVGLYAGYPYLALEFAERGSLRRETADGPRKPRWAAEVVRTVALAVQHAHDRGMLHRDLKPANVLVMADGTPKVTDFGLVKFADPIRQVSARYCQSTAWVNMLDTELSRFAAELGAQYGSDAPALGEDEITRSTWEKCAARTGVLGDGTRLQSVRVFLSEARQQARQEAPNLDGLTRAGAVMGSPVYMAPEQATGDLARIGPWTDVYALGGILYELLTGRPPCRAQPPRQLVPDVSGDIEAVCLRCLEKLPASRYQTAAALAEDLTRVLDGYSPRAVVPAAGGVRPAPSSATAEVALTLPPTTETPPRSAGATRSWWPFGRSRSGAKED
jgi:serine/threonine protein kinase